jgi:hypothetical protein
MTTFTEPPDYEEYLAPTERPTVNLLRIRAKQNASGGYRRLLKQLEDIIADNILHHGYTGATWLLRARILLNVPS